MNTLNTRIAGLMLMPPDIERDAPFAFRWFSSPHGKETLLRMGNSEHEIKPSTLEREKETIREFISLEKARKQLTWMLRIDNKTIGAIWVDLEPKDQVHAPGLHIMIGDIDYRGRGIGPAAMETVIAYIRDTLETPYVYSRNLVSNVKITKINQALGLLNDGVPYTDEHGLVWQNTKLTL